MIRSRSASSRTVSLCPKLRRCEARAAELGVSVIWRFEADGPEGLIDQRGQRRKDLLAGADPRWLDTARQVLAEHTQASKPTQDLVLAEVAARLDAEHGDRAVPVPKPTRARALLREITRGISAFGGTKAGDAALGAGRADDRLSTSGH